MLIIIIHQISFYQCAKTLKKSNVQKRQSQTTIIKCGNEYLNKTIGLSLTDDYLYQFLFVNKILQIIRYNYQKLIRNNDNENDYKLDLIDGHMMLNGLNDLIPENIAEGIMSIIQWIGNESRINNEKPIISISMSINKMNGKIHIYCLKSYDQFTYIVGDYNQEISVNEMQTFYITNNKMKHIMGTISDRQNEGIITFFYDRSYNFQMEKLSSKDYGIENFEWTKSLSIGLNSDYIFQSENIIEMYNEKEKKQSLKSFQRIFGTNLFTYGFIDNNQLYLFTNLNEILLTFSMDVIENKFVKYPFQLKYYQNFFYCQQEEGNFDDFFTIQILSTIKSIDNNDNNNNNDDNNNNNNKRNCKDNNNNKRNCNNDNDDNSNESKFFDQSVLRIGIIVISTLVLGPLLILLAIVFYRNCKYYYFHTNFVERIELQKSILRIKTFPTVNQKMNYQDSYYAKRLKRHHQQNYYQPKPQQQQPKQQLFTNAPTLLTYPITTTTMTTTTTRTRTESE